MTHGSLFSGIGGFDLAAEWMGWENLFNCEWEEFPRKVLKHHFPNAKQYGDIKEFNATAYAGRIDILSGGFPCQPYSTAGKRKGKEDERHLWPEMLRVVRECSPRWVVGENVRGLCSWNGGLVFEEVCADLEACGYSVQPFILPACAVNAPHRRDRIWFVAYRDNAPTKHQIQTGRDVSASTLQQYATDTDSLGNTPPRTGKEIKGNGGGNNGLSKERREQTQRADGLDGFSGDSPDPDCRRLEGATKVGRHGLNAERQGGVGNASDTDGERYTRASESRKARDQNRQNPKLRKAAAKHCGGHSWEGFPTEPPLCGRDDGLSKELDGITFPKWRRESIKAYGNAIVPQVALQIFKSIEAYES